MDWSAHIDVPAFTMEHHRATLASGVLNELQRWLEPQLVDEGFSFLDGTVSGTFWSDYDDPTFFGPNSLVTNTYDLTLAFRPASGDDSQVETVQLRFDWRPDSEPRIRPARYQPILRKWVPPPPQPTEEEIAADNARRDALHINPEGAPLSHAELLTLQEVLYEEQMRAVRGVDFGTVTTDGSLALGQFGDFDSPQVLACDPGRYRVTTLFPSSESYPACYTLIATDDFRAAAWKHLENPFPESHWGYFASDPRSLMLMPYQRIDTYYDFYEQCFDDPDDSFHDNFAWGCDEAPDDPNNEYLVANEQVSGWRINRADSELITFLCGGVAYVFTCVSGRRDGFLLKW